MRQDGTIVAVRHIRLEGNHPLGGLRLNRIAGSPDGRRIWAALTGRVPGAGHVTGAVLELPAF
jgi:hypothetical protein